MENEQTDIVIVGGGFFGTSLANYFANRARDQKRSLKIILLERENALLKRASFGNQARVHGGYHYPRSITTGLRSHENYHRFTERYRDCIVDSFKKYYAVASKTSKVSAGQFRMFCDRIGAPLRPATTEIRNLFSKDLIEAVFEVDECAFDASKLRERACEELKENKIDVRLNNVATKITKGPGGELIVATSTVQKLGIANEPDLLTAGPKISASQVFLCTYARMNSVLKASQLPLVPVRNEFTEMALIEVPEVLRNAGVTVMCGPFFSIMPFPSRGLHSLSHVRYTPIFSWNENDAEKDCPVYQPEFDHPATKFPFMRNDAMRYLPILQDCTYRDSIWEVKTLLPRNELDDARPILLKRDHGLPGLSCVIGGKIDNVFDMFDGLTAEMGTVPDESPRKCTIYVI